MGGAIVLIATIIVCYCNLCKFGFWAMARRRRKRKAASDAEEHQAGPAVVQEGVPLHSRAEDSVTSSYEGTLNGHKLGDSTNRDVQNPSVASKESDRLLEKDEGGGREVIQSTSESGVVYERDRTSSTRF